VHAAFDEDGHHGGAHEPRRHGALPLEQRAVGQGFRLEIASLDAGPRDAEAVHHLQKSSGWEMPSE